MPWQSRGVKIAVSDFTAADSTKGSVTCRGGMPIAAPNGKSYSDFIHDALVKELKSAKLYSPDSPVKLRGNLDSISFSSMTGASWDMQMTFNDGHGPAYTITSTYPFASSIIGITACERGADALMPAVQGLFAKLYRNAHFQKTLSAAAKK
jgi:hypothetical protein